MENFELDKILDVKSPEIKELPKPIIVPEPIPEKQGESIIDKDYAEIRKNLKNIISNSETAIDGILELAQDSDAPRAFEVVATLINASLEANMKLMELHKQVKEINRESVTKTSGDKITNNTIISASTKELLEMLKGSNIKKVINTNDQSS